MTERTRAGPITRPPPPGSRGDTRGRDSPAAEAALARATAGPLPAPAGEPRRARVPPPPVAIRVDDRPRGRRPAGPRSQRASDVAVGDEADALALGLVGGRESEIASHIANLGL